MIVIVWYSSSSSLREHAVATVHWRSAPVCNVARVAFWINLSDEIDPIRWKRTRRSFSSYGAWSSCSRLRRAQRSSPLLQVNKLRRCPAAQMSVAKSDFSPMRRRSLDLIKNVERFTRIDLDRSSFEKERNQGPVLRQLRTKIHFLSFPAPQQVRI